LTFRTIASAALLASVALSTVVSAAPASAAASGIWPSGPACPSKAPGGAWEFVRHVQPPFGLGYDLYRLEKIDGTYTNFSVYCR